MDGFPFVHRERVRFRDLDAMGHINNAVFATYDYERNESVAVPEPWRDALQPFSAAQRKVRTTPGGGAAVGEGRV